MRFGMRRVETAAQRVADLVMQRHADRAEHRTGEPAGILRLGAQIEIAGRRDETGSDALKLRKDSTAIMVEIGLRSFA